MKKNIRKSKKVLSILMSFIMAFVFINHNSMTTNVDALNYRGGGRSDSISQGYHSKSYYPVSTSGFIYAKDTFSFTVNKNGNITLHSVYQNSCGYPSKGWQVTYHGGSYVKVNTYWGSNPSIKIGFKKLKFIFPTIKKTTCHYTIYSNGTVKLDRKS